MSSRPTKTAASPAVMVFRPTMAEFQDFCGYVAYMESQGAHRAGIAKIIPPAEWRPRPTGYGRLAGDAHLQPDAIADLVIPTPIVQTTGGQFGRYQQMHVPRRSLTVREFHQLATSKRYAAPQQQPPAAGKLEISQHYSEMERVFWRDIPYSPPIYGADVAGTLSDAKSAGAWNPGALRSLLDLVDKPIRGVNSPYLYFGMWKASFAWHTEDMDLYSINYLHFGAPKSWYAVRPEDGRRFERLAALLFPAEQQACAAHLRHKTTLIAPQVLRRKGIAVQRLEQEAGEFVVTFPYGYHCGFNHGFNCAESSNFATQRWVEYGKRALQCVCKRDRVRINMDAFVRQFQPDRWRKWQMGLDVGRHPEDDGVAEQQRRVTIQRPPALLTHICSAIGDGCMGTLIRPVIPVKSGTSTAKLHICSPTKRHCRASLLPAPVNQSKFTRTNNKRQTLSIGCVQTKRRPSTKKHN